MTTETVLTVSAAVVALVQLVKWAGLKDIYGPLAVLLLSLCGVVFWGWTAADLSRTTAFGYFAGWISVSTSAAGIFGFTRASTGAVTRMTQPPVDGAGASHTEK